MHLEAAILYLRETAARRGILFIASAELIEEKADVRHRVAGERIEPARVLFWT